MHCCYIFSAPHFERRFRDVEFPCHDELRKLFMGLLMMHVCFSSVVDKKVLFPVVMTNVTTTDLLFNQ